MNVIELRLAKENGVLDVIYEQEVNRRIRQRYTLSQELAILRQRNTKPAEFNEYNSFVESCKTVVKAEFEQALK